MISILQRYYPPNKIPYDQLEHLAYMTEQIRLNRMGESWCKVVFTHKNGKIYTDEYRCNALYSVLHTWGELPEDIEIVQRVVFPEGHSWTAPTMDRVEMARALESMLKPYFDRG